jgi:hypothetical protein
MQKLLTLSLFALALPPTLASAVAIAPGRVKLESMESTKGNKLYVLWITGAVAYPMASDMEEAFAKAELDKPVAIDLDSRGGSVEEGKKIIRLIQAERARGRRVDTVVQNGNHCGSMCVPIFVQGENRIAGEVSAFMFHGATQAAFTNVPNALMTAELLNTFVAAGVNKDWLNSLKEKGVFSTPGEYWISGKDLLDAKSGVVTRLKGQYEQFEPWHAPFDPNIRSR